MNSAMPQFVKHGHRALQEDKWVRWLLVANLFCVFYAINMAWEKIKGDLRYIFRG
jgi:hypothetical protein